MDEARKKKSKIKNPGSKIIGNPYQDAMQETPRT